MHFVSSTLSQQLHVCVKVKVTGELWIVPRNLQELAMHLAVSGRAHGLDQPLLAIVTVAHTAAREWASRTASQSCAVLKPVILYAIKDYCQDRKLAVNCTIAF
jgi:hypothetical protein